MNIECPECSGTFHANQKYAYHAGFGHAGNLCCEACPDLVVMSSFDPMYVEIVGGVHPWMLCPTQKEKVESRLEACLCDGSFRFAAKPGCSLCNAEIPSILSGPMHFIETGKRFKVKKIPFGSKGRGLLDGDLEG